MCNCPDCGRKMNEEIYVRLTGKGNYSTYTCQTPGCLLQWVTLGPDKWATITEDEKESYRKMNRQGK